MGNLGLRTKAEEAEVEEQCSILIIGGPKEWDEGRIQNPLCMGSSLGISPTYLRPTF